VYPFRHYILSDEIRAFLFSFGHFILEMSRSISIQRLIMNWSRKCQFRSTYCDGALKFPIHE
jgi:hypothetical protein